MFVVGYARFGIGSIHVTGNHFTKFIWSIELYWIYIWKSHEKFHCIPLKFPNPYPVRGNVRLVGKSPIWFCWFGRCWQNHRTKCWWDFHQPWQWWHQRVLMMMICCWKSHIRTEMTSRNISGWWFGTMEFYDFPETVGNFIILTDELHHFSEG